MFVFVLFLSVCVCVCGLIAILTYNDNNSCDSQLFRHIMTTIPLFTTIPKYSDNQSDIQRQPLLSMTTFPTYNDNHFCDRQVLKQLTFLCVFVYVCMWMCVG